MRQVFGFFALFLLAGCDAARIETCAPGPGVICGLLRPEDIELVPGTDLLLVSVQGGRAQIPRIALVNPATGEQRSLTEPALVAEAGDFPRCGAAPEKLHPRGFHLSRSEDGALHVLVVADRRIERYRFDPAVPSLSWEGCVDVPPAILANDVAALPGGGLVVSHMFDPPRDFTLNLKFLFGVNTGHVAKWTPNNGWTKVPNTEVSFANGVQADPATSRIYVSSMFTQRVVAVDIDGSNRSESARLPVQGDNLSWSDDERLILAGHTGVAVYGILECRGAGDTPCSFPSAVVALDPKTLADQTLFQTPTGNIPGASVAVLKGDTLYLGSAFGDRITRVSIK
jgi:sugar lactone lactonase YvrE